MEQSERKIQAFRRLHEAGCFVMPNPWDAGSARFLTSLGFEALATTSAGAAFSLAKPDSATVLEREEVLANVRQIVEATELPVNADFQAGYGETPEVVGQSVALCVEAGVAGLSIEDSTGSSDRPLYSLPEALERLHAAREAIRASGRPVVLTARAECFLVGHPDPLRESLERLTAYAEAGADCLFAPGLRTSEEISAVVRAVAPRPVNVLVSGPAGLSLEDLTRLGARRISVGSALARVAWGAFMAAARQIASTGTFESLAGAAPFATLNDLFASRPFRSPS